MNKISILSVWLSPGRHCNELTGATYEMKNEAFNSEDLEIEQENYVLRH